MDRTLICLATLAMTLAACGGDSGTSSRDVPCEGNASGSLSLTDRAEMMYTVSFREDSGGVDVATIESVIVGRGAAGWKTSQRTRTPASTPTPFDSASLASSAEIGGVRVGYDRRDNAAWVQNERFALDSFNVVLIDRIDSVGGAPTVAQRLRIAPAIPLATGACGARTNPTSMAWADSIRARLMRAPQVRTFASP